MSSAAIARPARTWAHAQLTSHEAGIWASRNAIPMRLQVLTFLALDAHMGGKGCSANEIAKMMKKNLVTVRARCSDLLSDRLIEATGMTVFTQYGCKEMRFRITVAGLAELGAQETSSQN